MAKKEKISQISETLYDVLRKPVITEKATLLSSQNKVTFKITQDADKAQVKQAVEKLFNVKVTAVNIVRLPGKTKRFRGNMGTRSDTRKAIVTLAEGQTIDVMARI